MIVIDASAFIDAVDGRQSVIERLVNEDIHAPHLIDVDALSALRHLVTTGCLDQQQAIDAMSILERGDIRRHPHTPLLGVSWSLRDRVTAYDAAYVALAAALEAPLVTTDRKLAKLSGLPCIIEVPLS